MFKIALLQMTSCGTDQAAYVAKGEAFCRRAKASHADRALFPEMGNIGYTFFLEINPLSQYRSRAFENVTAPAMTNYATPQGNGSRDMTVIGAGGCEDVCVAAIDLERLSNWREYDHHHPRLG